MACSDRRSIPKNLFLLFLFPFGLGEVSSRWLLEPQVLPGKQVGQCLYLRRGWGEERGCAALPLLPVLLLNWVAGWEEVVMPEVRWKT